MCEIYRSVTDPEVTVLTFGAVHEGNAFVQGGSMFSLMSHMVHVAVLTLTTAIAQVDAVEPWARGGQEQLQEVVCPVFGCGLDMSYRWLDGRSVLVEGTPIRNLR